MAEEGIRALAAAHAARWQRDPATSRRARDALLRRPGSAARCWAASPMACTTSSATRSAAASTCRTPRLHTVVLPHALAYNAPAAPEAMARIAARARRRRARAGGAVRPGRRSTARRRRCGDSACSEADLDRAAELAVQNPYRIRGRSSAAPMRALLQRAFDGVRPD